MIIGSWSKPKRSGFSRRITFKSDGSFIQHIASKEFLGKFMNMLQGNKFEGSWNIDNQILELNYTNLPNSPLNMRLFGFKIPLADVTNSLADLFENHSLRLVSANKNEIKWKKNNNGSIEIWNRV